MAYCTTGLFIFQTMTEASVSRCVVGDPAFLYAKMSRAPEGEVLGFGLLTLSTLPKSAPLPASFSSTNGVFSFRVFSLLLTIMHAFSVSVLCD